MTDSGALNQWLISSVDFGGLSDEDSVVQWLQDVRLMTDTECMCVLQGKSLCKDPTDMVFTACKSTKEAIDTVRAKAHLISTEFSKLFRKVEKERWRNVQTSSLRLACQIRAMLHECTTGLPNPPAVFTEHQQIVMEECAKLAQYVESHIGLDAVDPGKWTIAQLLTDLGQSFSSLVDTALGALMKKLLSGIDLTSNHQALRLTLNNLVALGLEGEHMCYIIAKEGAIQKLFQLCQQEDLQFSHAQALRVIATICCVTESVTELERVSGVERLSDILANKKVSESVRAEAAGVVAQITSPSLEHYHHLPGFIENMEDLVHSLTELCGKAGSHEVFLLGCAALANMTFMDSMACDFLLQYHTASILIKACQNKTAHTLYAKDQVATVLANMAGVEACWEDIVSHQGLQLLVELLDERPGDKASEVEIAACERVHQKVGISLTRLSRDKQNAETLMELKVLPRLVELCKDASKRNNSDSVLVACLAALRKLGSQCGDADDTVINEVKQLIEPRLLDSFLVCSGLDESVV